MQLSEYGINRNSTSNMFEDLITSLCKSITDKYLQDFDASKLSFSVFGGAVELRDLKINPDALKDIHPALQIKSGQIGSLKVRLSYTKLKSEPVVVEISDILMFAMATNKV